MYNLNEKVKIFIKRYLKRLKIILLYCFQYIVILNYGNYANIVNKASKYTWRKNIKKSVLNILLLFSKELVIRYFLGLLQRYLLLYDMCNYFFNFFYAFNISGMIQPKEEKSIVITPWTEITRRHTNV